MEHSKLVAQTVSKIEHKQHKQRAIEHFIEVFKKTPKFNERKFKKECNGN